MTRARHTTKITQVNLQKAATDIEYAQNVSKEPGFYAYNPSFETDVHAQGATLKLLEARDYQFAHEAGLYIKSTDRIYFTANFQSRNPVTLYSISANAGLGSNVDEDKIDVRQEEYPEVSNANGACNYKDQVLYCAQGSLTIPSALTLVDPSTSPPESVHLLNNFNGRAFNSINDVVVHHKTGDIWFTDPTYGYIQDFRPAPQLPNQVYRFNPSTSACSVVADGFDMCNGLCFSPDYSVMYVTDTGAIQARSKENGKTLVTFDPAGRGTIYAFDVVDSGKILANRRTFAFTNSGIPDGIKCDENGYVYSGCGDGVHVWDKQGTLVGKIIVGDIVANFCFVKNRMWILMEKELWVCDGLKAKGALVDVEC